MSSSSDANPNVERRRHPRVPTSDRVKLSLSIVTNTEVIDVSAGGALLSTTAVLKPGQRAQLRLLLDREPFTAWVEVKRVESGTHTRELRYRTGTAFTAVDDRSEQTLRRFLREEPKSG